MKRIKFFLWVFLLVVIVFPLTSHAQESTSNQLDFSIDRIYQPFTFSKKEIRESKTLSDLNKFYKNSWVKEYYSVEVMVTQNGQQKKAIGKNEIITSEQKSLIELSDNGSWVKINVHYLPDNNLKNNEPKYFDFSFLVDVDKEARFAKGDNELNQYLKTKVIDKISFDEFDEAALAAIKFTIDEEGNITNVHIFETSRNENIDRQLIETIQSMPKWIPAEYTNHNKVKQEFVFTVGNMQSCIINTLNIKK